MKDLLGRKHGRVTFSVDGKLFGFSGKTFRISEVDGNDPGPVEAWQAYHEAFWSAKLDVLRTQLEEEEKNNGDDDGKFGSA